MNEKIEQLEKESLKKKEVLNNFIIKHLKQEIKILKENSEKKKTENFELNKKIEFLTKQTNEENFKKQILELNSKIKELENRNKEYNSKNMKIIEFFIHSRRKADHF